MQLAHTLEISLPGVFSSQAVQDEAQLVKASQQGDQEAFTFLVQRHQRRVFNMVLRMLQDYEEASEIIQEAFLAAWLGLLSFRGEARFVTWLYRIAYNCVLKQLERHKRERSLSSAIEAGQILEEVNKQKQAEDILELRAWQAIVREQTRWVMRIVHSRRPLVLASPSGEFALIRNTISSSEADPVLFLITKRVREPEYECLPEFTSEKPCLCCGELLYWSSVGLP